jgi:hypothetical protein
VFAGEVEFSRIGEERKVTLAAFHQVIAAAAPGGKMEVKPLSADEFEQLADSLSPNLP